MKRKGWSKGGGQRWERHDALACVYGINRAWKGYAYQGGQVIHARDDEGETLRFTSADAAAAYIDRTWPAV